MDLGGDDVDVLLGIVAAVSGDTGRRMELGLMMPVTKRGKSRIA